jgi:hypothetical protein
LLESFERYASGFDIELDELSVTLAQEALKRFRLAKAESGECVRVTDLQLQYALKQLAFDSPL